MARRALRVLVVLSILSCDIRWGFLKFDSSQERFVIDQDDISKHIVELRRQLSATRSVFGWTNAYNKYMKFFVSDFSGRPAACFGRKHVDEAIDTLARIQRELFPDSDGGPVGHLRRMIAKRFGVEDLPQGYFYLPIGCGGLELHDPMIEYFSLRESLETEPQHVFTFAKDADVVAYKVLKESWERHRKSWSTAPYNIRPGTQLDFLPFEGYVAHPVRLLLLPSWRTAYTGPLAVRVPKPVALTPSVGAALKVGWKGVGWEQMTFYDKWIVSVYGEEVMTVFGGLEVWILP